MIQAIQHMLSRRSQLAALMVMAALVAAAFAALSTSSAQTTGAVVKDEVTFGLHVYFPDDTDGVFVAKSGNNAGVDRVPVAIELRATIPYGTATTSGDEPAIVFGTADGEDGPVTPFAADTVNGADILTGLMSPDPDETQEDTDSETAGVQPREDGVLLGITGGSTGTAQSGSRISLSGGNKFNIPNVATLYFDNSTPDDVMTTTEVDESIRTETNPAVVLDCGTQTEFQNADGTSTREGNRPADGSDEDHKNADGKRFVTRSCFVVLGWGVIGNDGRYPNYADPRVFIAGLSDRTNIDITARLNLGNLGVSWDGGDVVGKRKSFRGAQTGSATLRINNGENEVAAAALALSLNTRDNFPCTGLIGVECPSQITTAQGGNTTSTWLTLAVTNSEGNVSNWNGIRTIEVQTSRGDITDSYGRSNLAADGTPDTDKPTVKRNCFGKRICQWTGLNTVNDPWVGLATAGQIGLKLQSTSTETGTATVTARVQSINGSWIDADPVSVRIAGPANSLALAPAASNLYWGATTAAGDNRDRLAIVPTATDASGEDVRVNTLHPSSWTVTGPDNRRVANTGNFALDNTRGATVATDDNDAAGFGLIVTATDAAATRLKPGVYKLEVRIDGSTQKQTMEFTVVGPAADAETTLVADPPAPAGVRTPVTLTATVNDAEGNPVADGTNVTFSIRPAGGGTAAALLDTTPTRTAKTKGGVASRTTIVVGSGLTVVTATADTIVKTLLINVGGSAQATETRDITGLSSLNGFSNWRPDNTVTAGELYRGLQARGVGLLWKYNPDGSWLRFGLLPGGAAQIPGSDPDFEIQSGDTLFIGGRN